MSKIQYLKRKIGESYLVWLKNSNLYVQLEEPAWFVFRKIAKQCKTETIAAEFADRYGLPFPESLTFASEIRSGIDSMNQSFERKWSADKHPADIQNHQFEPYSIHQYHFGDNLIRFSYESRLFEYYIHPLVRHLETDEIKEGMPLFELYAYNEKIVFRLNGEVKGVWTNDETNLVKGLIFINLINVMFGKSEDFWLMTVHASAITNERKTIVFSAGPGSGKTTMAALLQERGLRLVSDDFVPIDRQTFYAWPFPIAMSVKEGAMEMLSAIYPQLDEKPQNRLSPEKVVRYLFLEEAHEFSTEPFPVKEFVFIKYNKDVEFEWKKLDLLTAVKLLLDQSFVTPQIGAARAFLDHLDQWSFYQLTYSDNKKALNQIENLFEHDE